MNDLWLLLSNPGTRRVFILFTGHTIYPSSWCTFRSARQSPAVSDMCSTSTHSILVHHSPFSFLAIIFSFNKIDCWGFPYSFLAKRSIFHHPCGLFSIWGTCAPTFIFMMQHCSPIFLCSVPLCTFLVACLGWYCCWLWEIMITTLNRSWLFIAKKKESKLVMSCYCCAPWDTRNIVLQLKHQ